MGDKKPPRLTPEQNEARQAARAAGRERAKDARLVAELAVQMWTTTTPLSQKEAVSLAAWFLREAKESL